jgi:carboxyl-terminal processing protease
VTPDISLPTLTDEDEFGESSYENALPWTQIKAADYTRAGNLTAIIPRLMAKHAQRVADDKDFKYLQEDIAEITLRRKKNSISLNETERRNERAEQEARSKLREKNLGTKSDVAHASTQDDGLQSNERNLDADLAIEKARKDAKDILLDEAAHILSDQVGLLKSNAKLAASARQ